MNSTQMDVIQWMSLKHVGDKKDRLTIIIVIINKIIIKITVVFWTWYHHHIYITF